MQSQSGDRFINHASIADYLVTLVDGAVLEGYDAGIGREFEARLPIPFNAAR